MNSREQNIVDTVELALDYGLPVSKERINQYKAIIEKEKNKMRVNVMLDNGAYMPEKAHEEDAGFDLRTPVNFVLNRSILIDTGVHIEIPQGYVGMIKSKSGLNVKDGITTEGVIDCGYTGSIKVKMYSDEQLFREFKKGDKITQLVILPIPEVNLIQVDKLEETERGNNGFGSTGR